ncbi:helix-turn-helix domain-containing protein [Nonomuraea sp. CA-143628]|uniref:helix-turn-helix domain-containing protein n=1 Tax=Nonomuraea sp. CA-143628 TaxID=3239997 RepID=UPI003D8D3AEE
MDIRAIGERVRAERERAGLNQRDLAGPAGLSQPTLARIELGTRTRLTVAELDRIATALGIPLADLTRGNPVRERIRIAARISQAEPEATAAAVRQAVDILVLDDRLDQLAAPHRTPVTAAPGLPDPGLPPDVQGQGLARTVRHLLDLGGAPLADPGELAERLTGADTAVLDFPAGIDGFTITDPVRGVVLITVGSRAVAERQRFTFAHELGHLLFGDGTHSDAVSACRTPAEIRCDAFARHLLAPQDGIRAWLGPAHGPLDERACALLARHFGVSLMVILIQLQHLGLLTATQVDALRGPTGAQLARRYGWSRQYEREQETARTRRPPRRVLERATIAYRADRLGIRALAGLEGRDPDDLEIGLADAGISPCPANIRHADLGRLLTRARTSEEA